MDDMTGLYSKNKLLETVEHMEPKERPVVVIYWDVNQLKYVNDTFGHGIGDEAIRIVAGLFKDVFYDDCIVGRIGGDEFMVFCRTPIHQCIQRFLIVNSMLL